ncbi:unnamed protein product [Acanthoscelides obtectus]|uniref:MD-2-related lipid-recognition domain-containing protein n=1 Tax=Acanthoscelides obtectus TaxID=200917 RepID=A0A9P0K306_ACAOB|nr:unnamed protein product [Acanthoscelides obtectus]CAK1631426.1 hypothetical protein AOBTE_LOCUS6946 [Acanthoscelides obtectus]
MKSVFALYVAIWQLSLIECSFDAAVPVGNTDVIIHAVYPCDGVDPSTYSEIELKDDGNEKWVEFMIQMDQAIDDTFTANMVVDQWKNGAWEENIYNTDGTLCDMKEQFARKCWYKLAEASEPKADPTNCYVAPGTYIGKKYQAAGDDLDIPSMLFGTFRVRFDVFNEENDLFFCTMIELEASPK